MRLELVGISHVKIKQVIRRGTETDRIQRNKEKVSAVREEWKEIRNEAG